MTDTKIHLHENVTEVSVASPATPDVLVWNGSAWVNESAPIEQRAVAIVLAGTLTTGVKPPRIQYPFTSGSIKFTSIMASIATASTGADVQATVRRSALTVGSVTITAGSYAGSTSSITQEYWSAGYYLDVNVTQVGSTVAGSDLCIQIIGDGIGLTKRRVT